MILDVVGLSSMKRGSMLIQSCVAIANAYAALEAGATHVDTSVVSLQVPRMKDRALMSEM